MRSNEFFASRSSLTPQQEVEAFLASQTTERIETHISLIFLGDGIVYKLKRAVTLPYVDFSTLDARRHACEAELALNRRTAPTLYRRVAAITRADDGGLEWNGPGEVQDWVVEMNRFDQDKQLDRAPLDRTLIQQLADTVAAMHQNAEIMAERGGYDGLRWVVEGNDESFRRAPPTVFSEPAITLLTRHSRQQLAEHRVLLEERRLAGKVRRCHGDLHLGNICLIDGKPVPFDAIEFSDAIACIDILYDLAFLVMDLDHRGEGELAALLLARWLAATGEFAALPLLPVMLSLRAAIRSHIAGVQDKVEEARAYLALAERYLSPPPPRLLAIGGVSGTGKSLLSRRLAPLIGAAPGAVVLRTDVIRKHLMGVPPETRLPPEAYEETVTEKVYDALFEQAEQVLRAGHAVIVDAVSALPGQRRALADLAARLEVPFDGLWLHAGADDLRRRITERRNNASDATVAVLERQLDFDLGPMDWTLIDSSGAKEQTVDLARGVLNV
jgi:aminoglycoside phosphotransferase family enzyme/predicted kinase